MSLGSIHSYLPIGAGGYHSHKPIWRSLDMTISLQENEPLGTSQCVVLFSSSKRILTRFLLLQRKWKNGLPGLFPSMFSENKMCPIFILRGLKTASLVSRALAKMK